jgi:hypothetical protein
MPPPMMMTLLGVGPAAGSGNGGVPRDWSSTGIISAAIEIASHKIPPSTLRTEQVT